MIKAIGFDVGHTLIKYNNPLNWSSLYEVALQNVMLKCNISISKVKIHEAINILNKYNTRINYRETEVTSDIIFGEITELWQFDIRLLDNVKESFYQFFQNEAVPYEDVAKTLEKLKDMNIKIGILTDVAYGMDNRYSLSDIKTISQYIDVAITSVDVGFRKPNEKGFLKLMKELNTQENEMLYVGDEEKDIVGSNHLGITSVLINRGNKEFNYGQVYSINTLETLIDIIKNDNRV